MADEADQSDSSPSSRDLARLRRRRRRYFPTTFRAARKISQTAAVPFEEAWRIAWIREHHLPLGYTAEILRTYRAACDKLISAFDIQASGAEGRHLARLKSVEASRALGILDTTPREGAYPPHTEALDMVKALESLGWETIDSKRGGIRVRLTARATALAEQHERGDDLVIVWTEAERWAWGTAEHDADPLKITELRATGAQDVAETMDALLRHSS